MKDKDPVILKKIQRYCTEIQETLDMFETDYERFQTVSTFRNACCMCVLQIGELCKVLSPELCEENSEIPWKNWCGIRDVFAHQYTKIDYESAWETITQDIPVLRNTVNKLLESIEDTR